MNFFNTLFSKKQEIPAILVDMHSHVLPSIDDGSESMEESLLLLERLQALGYKKLIATPHIMGDFFKNTPEIIYEKLAALRSKASEKGITLALDAAAEYYLDEWFMERLARNDKLLTFGRNYLLFELSYINSSPYLDEAIFTLLAQGYTPVLAHPERYVYWHGNTEVFQTLHNKGVILQVNINSLSGYYNKGAQKTAELLIELGLVKMFGTDCHGHRHIDALHQARKTRHYKNALPFILNNTLLQ